jgi:hypothetical protein
MACAYDVPSHVPRIPLRASQVLITANATATATGTPLPSPLLSSSPLPSPLLGSAPLNNWSDKIMQYLYINNKSTFVELFNGLTASDISGGGGRWDAKGRSAASTAIREEIQVLAENFCIYLDGDKYCPL